MRPPMSPERQSASASLAALSRHRGPDSPEAKAARAEWERVREASIVQRALQVIREHSPETITP